MPITLLEARPTPLSTHPFSDTPERRRSWARERFFRDGVRPTGLVSEAVIQSWSRCLMRRQSPHRELALNPVTNSRIQLALGRHRPLLQAAADELHMLKHTLVRTGTAALLLDASGMVMHTSGPPTNGADGLLPLIARVGVCLTEEAVGTTAAGIARQTGLACTVTADEHFSQALTGMACAAAPIHDAAGRLLAVLDLCSNTSPFGFDALGLAVLYAKAIENQWLCAAAHQQLVLRLHVNRALLPSPLVGLVGIDSNGHLAWANQAAVALLGLPGWPLQASPLSDASLGLSLAALLRLAAAPRPQQVRLPTGLALWVQAQCPTGRAHASDDAPGMAPADALDSPLSARPAATEPAVVHAPEPGLAPASGAKAEVTSSSSSGGGRQATLRDSDRRLVAQTLADCGGNVSLAARRLGVSRGLIYRHLRSALAC